MISKNIDQIKEADIQALINNSVIERKTLEYKLLLPSDMDSEKKEFLADVSSFANASGGDILYGIKEDRVTGTPKSIEGLVIQNVDQEIGRLDNIIRTGISPRITGITIRSIDLINGNIVLIIRIPKSWINPHRVIFSSHDKFYSRSTNGKYPMDVAELRIAFTLSDTIADRVRRFRQERISKLLASDLPIPFYGSSQIVLHLIPINSFNPSYTCDLSKIASNPGTMLPIGSSMYSGYRYNLDGYITYYIFADNKSDSYTQIFRNGIIEAVEGSLLGPYNGTRLIPSVAYEKELIKSLNDYLLLLKSLSVELPIFIFLSLVNVKGYTMTIDKHIFRRENYTIDRDVIMLPEAIVESYDVKAKDVLRPSFDSIWNACGYPKSLNYDNSGKWVERKTVV